MSPVPPAFAVAFATVFARTLNEQQRIGGQTWPPKGCVAVAVGSAIKPGQWQRIGMTVCLERIIF